MRWNKRVICPPLTTRAFPQNLPNPGHSERTSRCLRQYSPFQRWCDLNDRNLYLTVLDVQSPRSRCQLILFLVRAVFLTFFQLSSHHILTWWREREGCGVTLSSFMDTNLSKLGPHPYDLIKPQLLLYSK